MLLQYDQQPIDTSGSLVSRNDTGGGGVPRVSFAMVRLPNGEAIEVDQSNPVAGADGRIIQRHCYNCGS